MEMMHALHDNLYPNRIIVSTDSNDNLDSLITKLCRHYEIAEKPHQIWK